MNIFFFQDFDIAGVHCLFLLVFEKPVCPVVGNADSIDGVHPKGVVIMPVCDNVKSGLLKCSTSIAL